jgi:uncharacterized protein (TIGR03435 family)
MSGLAAVLSRWTDRPVVDMTGISGVYNFKLNWKEDSTVAPNPEIVRPLEQLSMDAAPALHSVASLGLRAERRKVPLKYFIVDHAEKEPTAN